MTTILCLETSATVCSVAIATDREVVAIREINEGFNHSAKLTVFISELLNETGIEIINLDAIAVSSGPGSYTGLRIGVSVAKGLCFSIDKPLISIPTLEALSIGAAEKISDQEDIILFPMIDARRMEVYCAQYDLNISCISPPMALVVMEIMISMFHAD